MIDKLSHIKAGDKEYPIAFTMNVIEIIQEKFGTLDQWSKAMEPDDDSEAQIKDVIWTFQEFINEGIDMENEERTEKVPFVTHKQVGRIISSLGFAESIKTITSLTSGKGKTPGNTTGDLSGEEKNLTTT
ncbi:MAG: hypothetical protein WC047_04390 [Kiritimatiellales bacterium]